MPGKRKARTAPATPIETVRHKDKRKNIPTEELRDFVADEENNPKTVLYPRNPDLDPQLVWKGKDEQDSQPLEVPAVPIYIQEKIHPQAIIEDFRRNPGSPGILPGSEHSQDGCATQLNLFADFNGLPEDFHDRIDFYHHDGNWSNRLILGDSLLVMTSLAQKEGLKGRVQMIYIDPPYGIKFGSNWQVSTRRRDVKDGKGEDFTRQPEQVQAFRDTWKLGIHSYLPYLRDRLVVGRDLLTESGSIFVQIGDENVHLVRCLMDEVFGAENFCAIIAFAKTTGQTSTLLAETTDYLLWYARERGAIKYRQLYEPRKAIENPNERYVCVESDNGKIIDLSVRQKVGEEPLPAGRILRLADPTSQTGSESSRNPFVFRGRLFVPPGSRGWSTHDPGLLRLASADLLHVVGNTLVWKNYRDWFPHRPLTTDWRSLKPSGFGESRWYVVQTTTDIVGRCLLMTTDPGDLVLDPTCGSGTTAYVAEQWGRRWITIDTSRVSVTLARTRLMAGRFPYYLLADSPDGIEKEADLAGRLPPRPLPKTEGDVRRGFVYKRVPHVTLKAIANNEEIDPIHAAWQEKLEPIRAGLNKLLKKKWQDWEIPRELDVGQASSLSKETGKMPVPQQETGKMPAPQQETGKMPVLQEAKKLLRQWWDGRRQRQAEIDATIARRADTEMLYDQPYEDNKRVRVTGPFTVESLSPHRTISVEEKKRLAEEGDPKLGLRITKYGPDQFGNMILDLAAYWAAGKPNMKLTPWGSFEAWSDSVRSAVVWVGLDDPGSTRRELTSQSDREAAALRQLIAGWEELDPNSTGLTVAAVLEELADNPTCYVGLRSALWELVPSKDGRTINPKSLAMKLHHLRRRVVDGKCFDSREDVSHRSGAIWRITSSDSFAGTTGTTGSNLDHTRAQAHARAHARENAEATGTTTRTARSPAASAADCPHADVAESPTFDGYVNRACRQCGQALPCRRMEVPER